LVLPIYLAESFLAEEDVAVLSDIEPVPDADADKLSVEGDGFGIADVLSDAKESVLVVAV